MCVCKEGDGDEDEEGDDDGEEPAVRPPIVGQIDPAEAPESAAQTPSDGTRQRAAPPPARQQQSYAEPAPVEEEDEGEGEAATSDGNGGTTCMRRHAACSAYHQRAPCLTPVPPAHDVQLPASRAAVNWQSTASYWSVSTLQRSTRRAQSQDFVISDPDEAGAAGEGSDPPSPLLLEPRDPDAPPPDWNVAREPVPDLVSCSMKGGR